ncbi:hypothetical protein JCM8547_004082 [Rhodosporidiobolus lusitaniae]
MKLASRPTPRSPIASKRSSTARKPSPLLLLLPSPSLAYLAYLVLLIFFLLLHLPVFLAFLRSGEVAGVRWAALPLDLKLALATKKVGWVDGVWRKRGEVGVREVVYAGQVWSVAVALGRTAWGFNRALFFSPTWKTATHTALVVKRKQKTPVTPSSLDVVLFTLFTLASHALAHFLAFSTLLGATSWLTLVVLSLVHSLSWLSISLTVKFAAAVTGIRCTVWRRLMRSSVGSVFFLLVSFV